MTNFSPDADSIQYGENVSLRVRFRTFLCGGKNEGQSEGGAVSFSMEVSRDEEEGAIRIGVNEVSILAQRGRLSGVCMPLDPFRLDAPDSVHFNALSPFHVPLPPTLDLLPWTA